MANNTDSRVRLEGASLVLALDRQQSIQNPNAVVCPRDKEHGRLLVLKGGSMLGCTICAHMQPAELDLTQLEEPRKVGDVQGEAEQVAPSGPAILMRSLRGRK